MITHVHEDDLVLHYYGEMTDADESRVVSHLAACGACGESYRRLQRVLTAIEASAPAEAADGFERTVWARLEPELSARNLRQGWRGWLVLSPPHLALAAAVVVLVGGAFFAGRLVPRAGDAGP